MYPPHPAVVQLARLSGPKTEQLQEAMDQELDDALESGDIDRYHQLMKAYNAFEEGSEKLALKPMISASGFSQAVSQVLDWKSVRGANYPSGFNSAATKARDTYVNAHKDPKNSGQWECQKGHWASTSDVTIDHVVPVATHWNNIGYDTDKATRTAWFNDTTNHEYVCKSCNSSMGSGGVFYVKAPGLNYTA